MIFAEASNQFMGEFVYALFALLGGIVAAVSIWAMTRKKSTIEIEPQPVQTQRAPKRFNHDLAEQRHQDHDRRIRTLEDWRDSFHTKLEADKLEIIAAGEERSDKIRDHVERVRRELDDKIDGVPDRVIATLKNTGAI